MGHGHQEHWVKMRDLTLVLGLLGTMFKLVCSKPEFLECSEY
jgi:hypothetical protein